MEKINIYAINLNPTGIDQDRSLQKSRIIKNVFDSYKKNLDPACALGEVVLFSFCPKENNGYTSYIEDYIDITAKKPCILIFGSLLDLSNSVSVSCNRLNRYRLNDGIRAIYFSDYSIDQDVSTYLNTLAKLFKSEDVFKRVNTRKSLSNKKLRDAVLFLREQKVPVVYEDIAETLGIPSSTLRSLKSYAEGEGFGKRGRNITQDEINFLVGEKKAAEDELKDSIVQFKETYIE